MKKLLCACFVLALGMCFAPIAWGQATGSFSGTVLDKSGAPISGATVTAISQGTGVSRSARTPLSGPDFVNTDFSVIKQFALPWENMGLNFRAEFFNLFNHPQLATPNAAGGLGIPDIGANITGFMTNASTSGFGAINSTVNGPRLIQFGLKLTF